MADTVTIRTNDDAPPKVSYALDELEDAFAERGLTAERTDDDDARIVAGTPRDSAEIADLVASGDLDVPDAEEALAIRHLDGTTYAAGSDDQGLMYALLEVAETLRYRDLDLEEVPETVEAPDTETRCIYNFLRNDDLEEEWFYSESYWERYFDLLAKSRYNAFHLIPGGHKTPLFRHFVRVEEHPEVAPDALTEEERERNLEMLVYITTLAEERGLDFVLGIWQVIVWDSYFEGPMESQESLIEGLEWENLESYTYRGLSELLSACPGFKGVQLRVNFESGIPLAEQAEFYRNSVFRALEEAEQDTFLDLRGWRCREETIEVAEEMDFEMRLSMKYWAEHLGGPYQPADHWPSYSYADFLKQPYHAPVFYQVWSIGSHRVFLWGDPEYVRTFTDSLDLGDSVGFEIAPPLASKGFGNDPGAWRVFEEEYEHYEWEFERYWLFFRLFGRLTYDADAPEDVWMRLLRARFGDEAETVMDAYEAASKVMTFIMRFNMSDPNVFMFPEIDTGGVLDFYLDVQPSDPALVKSFREAVDEEVTGEFTARLDPEGASEYLRSVGEECLTLVESLRGSADGNAELRATLVDVEALGELALYHAEKILATVELTRFYETDDLAALYRSARQLETATPHWERLSSVTEDVYHDELVIGPVDNLSWSDKLPFVEEDVVRIQEQYRLNGRYGNFVRGFDFGGVHEFDPYELYRYLNRTWEGEQPWLHDYYVERGFTGVDEHAEMDRLNEYGWTNTDGLSSETAPLVRLADKHNDDRLRLRNLAPIWTDSGAYGNQLYVDYVSGTEPRTFVTTLEPGTYEVTVILADRSQNSTDHGPLSVTVDGEEVASGVTVPAGDVVDLDTVVEVDKDRLEVTFAAEEGGDWIATGLVVRPVEPVIAHSPVRRVDAGDDAVISASVTCPDEVEAVTLCLEGQDGAVRRLRMERGPDEHLYDVTVPDDVLHPGIPATYWFEARSETGRTARLPDRTAEEDGFELLSVVPGRGPAIRHEPVASCRPGEAAQITATVESPLPLSAVRLHYRHVNHYEEYRTVRMDRVRGTDSDAGDEYGAEIPGEYVGPEWDVLYYIEAVDVAGNGSFSPAPTPAENPISGVPYNVIDVER